MIAFGLVMGQCPMSPVMAVSYPNEGLCLYQSQAFAYKTKMGSCRGIAMLVNTSKSVSSASLIYELNMDGYS
jgi:hypothetical protein